MTFNIEIPPISNRVDKLTVVAPASKATTSAFESFSSLAEQYDITVEIDKQNFLNGKWTTGTDTERASALINALNHDASCVIAARGGYGTPRLDFDDIIAHTKPGMLIGYSDISFALSYLSAFSDIHCIHGPMPQDCEFEAKHASMHVLFGYLSGRISGLDVGRMLTEDMSFLREGSFAGELIGGNLTCVQNMLGTTAHNALNGRVLFLEEVGEKMYAIDRMLQHIKRAGVFENIAALVLGDFRLMDEAAGFTHNDLFEAVLDATHQSGIPVVTGLPVGHGSKNIPLPYKAILSGYSDNRFAMS